MKKIKPDEGEKRDAILDAALELFQTNGYEATPVPLVAERAGVATGTIYLYFRSKEELVNAVWRKWKLRLAESLLHRFPEEEDIRTQFFFLFHTLAEFSKIHPEAFSFLEFHNHRPYLNRENLETDTMIRSFLEDFLKRGQKQKILQNMQPDAMTAMVVGSFIGLFKASQEGQIRLNTTLLAKAAESCWRMVSLK